ncbi:Hybrid signal transduction histidine kinase J [Seminavis robusta]|uniref:Hybrid signal transduction histidine kinase J n=1 Tax=Seminavis robusta TaxID=568900 RepID=A0A9N8EW17_9STRA|nr:Hybrid signal transduction histidine kinase J [Seminavis robusta]|eukprot:Sro1854_g301880.1 Hybrid signal transduction histidine kinase J (903) ;mRNA; r:12182-15058
MTTMTAAEPTIVVTDHEYEYNDDDDDLSFATAASSESSTTSTSSNDQPASKRARLDHDKLRLLDGIATVQRQYLMREEPRVVFGTLLEKLLDLMDSEYGFIGEVMYKEEDGSPYLQTHAITNIAWNAVTRAFYNDNVDHGLKFFNMKSLFGQVIVTAEPMVCNAPQDHPAACGIPEGHPPLDHFLGIPFFESTTRDDNGPAQLVGMVGIANKPGGYTEADVEFLEPFVTTCSNLIQAYNAVRKNQELVDTLEQRVQERTQELQKSNESLEEVNRKLEAASQAQLQTFASITHEIRTPLNCVIGLSSLLQETNLSPYQQDCLQMIVTSGDLLLTVVNDVLDYSKLETGNVEIAVKPSNIQTCLDAVVHSIAQKARDKNLTVATSYDPAVPETIDMDNRRLQQILYNLLGNSVKFSPPEGVIELKVGLVENPYRQQQQQLEDTAPQPQGEEADTERPDPTNATTERDETAAAETDKPVSSKPSGSGGGCPFLGGKEPTKDAPPSQPATAGGCPFLSGKEPEKQDSSSSMGSSKSPPGAMMLTEEDQLSEGLRTCDKILRFRVKDYGNGIPRKDFARIFKPFKQANSMIETSHGGTGLGLAIVTKLVKGLGGAISVDSVVGQWTEFAVDFPFTGKLFDVKPLTKELQRGEIISIEQPGSNSGSNLLSELGVNNVRRFDSMESLLETMSPPNNGLQKDRFYLTLVDEQLHDATQHKQFKNLTKQKTAMVTHGPNYGVKETNLHFRSLRQVLPSVLIRSLAAQMKASSHGGPEVESPEAARPISYDRLRILVAEDNIINQKVLGRMLSRLGVTNVEFADNGEIAVTKNKEQEFDLIFMDMQMPIMDGLEATKLIVKHRGDKALPKVVFVTANVSEKFEEEASDAGGDGYISKPFSLGVIDKAFSGYL